MGQEGERGQSRSDETGGGRHRSCAKTQAQGHSKTSRPIQETGTPTIPFPIARLTPRGKTTNQDDSGSKGNQSKNRTTRWSATHRTVQPNSTTPPQAGGGNAQPLRAIAQQRRGVAPAHPSPSPPEAPAGADRGVPEPQPRRWPRRRTHGAAGNHPRLRDPARCPSSR